MSNVLIIAPHPDDEILGCGGTLLRHKDAEDRISIVYVTQMQEGSGFSSERIASRDREINTIKEKLAATIYQLEFATASLTDQDAVTMIPQLSSIFAETQPEIIYLPNRSDAHSDHRISFNASFACTKVFRCPTLKSILVYETLSETEFSANIGADIFVPNYYVDISKYFDAKIQLMEIYESELGEHPFPRSIASIKALATLRGSTAGVGYAESFQLIKHIH